MFHNMTDEETGFRYKNIIAQYHSPSKLHCNLAFFHILLSIKH